MDNVALKSIQPSDSFTSNRNRYYLDSDSILGKKPIHYKL